MKTLLIILAIMLVIFIVPIYSCAKVSGKCSKLEEQRNATLTEGDVNTNE